MVCNATCATFYLQSFADTVHYKTLDPEECRPALGVTFDRRGQKLCIITAYWNETPRTRRMLPLRRRRAVLNSLTF
jgi:hypothetical protein